MMPKCEEPLLEAMRSPDLAVLASLTPTNQAYAHFVLPNLD